jgi:type II secretory pathway component PulF
VLEVKSGKTLAAAFQTESLFSDDVIKSISWGETSGELPEFLNQCATRLKDKIKISIQILSKAIPHIIHLFCVAYVGYKILVLYLGSFSSLSKLL